MAQFRIHIATVDEVLFDDEATAVTAPGVDGLMTVLSHHEPLVSTLRSGVITVRGHGDSQNIESFPVTEGVIEISNNKATILL
jgi:F-type H+-transporting ATPase subunit epsilon